MEMQGLPYGPKARLLLLHLCTEAVRQRSPVGDALRLAIRQAAQRQHRVDVLDVLGRRRFVLDLPAG
jgi:hypothetical protein